MPRFSTLEPLSEQRRGKGVILDRPAFERCAAPDPVGSALLIPTTDAIRALLRSDTEPGREPAIFEEVASSWDRLLGADAGDRPA